MQNGPLIGVLALQGAFEEHEHCLRNIGCRTRQVRTTQDLDDLDGIILPGGESTAMGLIGTSTVSPIIVSSNSNGTTTTTTTTTTKNMWESLQVFTKPIWGTCAGMILLAEQCIGTSAVIQDGQALIGGMNICVARNYFGSQVSSFEMSISGPPTSNDDDDNKTDSVPFPGVFIRAPAILTVGSDVEILGKVVATPCRQAAITLQELDRKIANGENVIKMGVVDALERESGLRYKETAVINDGMKTQHQDEHNIHMMPTIIQLPGAADGTNAREVICAAKKGNILCTAFHPELTDDYRWHEYFVQMVLEAKKTEDQR